MSASDGHVDIPEALASRRSTLMRMHQDKLTRYVVRFMQDNTYMVADRAIIINAAEAPLCCGANVEVIYDKASKLSGPAVILFAGPSEKANALERALSAEGLEKESEVLRTFAESGGLDHTLPKQKCAKRKAKKSKPESDEHAMMRQTIAGDPQLDVHLSCGSAAEATNDCAANDGVNDTIAATMNALRTVNEDERYNWFTSAAASLPNTSKVPARSSDPYLFEDASLEQDTTVQKRPDQRPKVANCSVGTNTEGCQHSCQCYDALSKKMDVLIGLYGNLVVQAPPSGFVGTARRRGPLQSVSRAGIHAASEPHLDRVLVTEPQTPAATSKTLDDYRAPSPPDALEIPEIGKDTLDQLRHQGANSHTHFALEVFKRVFKKAEIMNCNVNGTHGKDALCPRKIAYIRSAVRSYYFLGCTDAEFRPKWQLCVDAINMYSRRATVRQASQQLIDLDD
jgi:hypothetical protein